MTTEYWIKIDPDAQPQVLATGGEEAMNLQAMQNAVGGLIEYCTFAQNVELPVPHNGRMVLGEVLDVIANEEGRLVNNPIPNAIGTYCAFGMPAPEAPYAIVGAVLVHVRVADDAQEANMEKLLEMVLGIKVAQSMTQDLQEADYGVDE